MPPKKSAQPAEPESQKPTSGTSKFIYDSESHYYDGDWQIVLPEADPSDKKAKKAPEPTDEELQKFKKRQGNGVYVWNDMRYEGEWESDEMNGQGKLRFVNGDVYEGDFKRGKIEGVGKFEWVASGAWYKGEFQNNRMHGKGLYVTADGRRFHGTFYNGIGPGLERELVEEEMPSVIQERMRKITEQESQDAEQVDAQE